MNVIQRISDAVVILDEVDNYFKSIPEKQSENEVLHFLGVSGKAYNLHRHIAQLGKRRTPLNQSPAMSHGSS